MKTLRVIFLSILLIVVSAVAFSPKNSIADLTILVSNLVTLQNGNFIKGVLSSGASQNLIGPQSGGTDTVVDAVSGSNIEMQNAGSERWRFDNNFRLLGAQSGSVVGTTSADASDNKQLQVLSYNGSGIDKTRGAGFELAGNESGDKGDMYFYPGNSSGGGHIHLGRGTTSSLISFENASGSNVATIDNQGGITQVPYVPTMTATPVAGTNDIKSGLNVIPTAAANTAALLAATPTAGAEYIIYNSNSANSVRVKAGGASTMNGVTAGGYVVLAAKTSAFCYADNSGSNYVCELNANPTPAGP